MLQPINKKLTIDYHPNKRLTIEYGDYEKQKKNAFFIKFQTSFIWWIPFILCSIGMCFINIPPHNLPIVLLLIALLLSSLSLPFIILFIGNRFVYYKLEITPKYVNVKYFSASEKYLFTDKIFIEIHGLEKGNLFSFSIDDSFYFTFDTELEQPQKTIVLSHLIELLNLEFIETKTIQSGKSSWEKSIYQSKTN